MKSLSTGPDGPYRRSVPSAPVRRNVAMSAAVDRAGIVEVLRETKIFGGLADDNLGQLAEVCATRTFGRGQYLWYQGDEGDRLLVVVSGLLKVVLSSPQGDDVVLTILGRSETVGELALLDGSPRSAAVIAIEPTTVVMLTRPTVVALMSRHPAVLDGILRSLGQLVRRLSDQTGDLMYLDLGGRLAKVFLRLAEDHAVGSRVQGDPVVLDLGLSQSDLAAMVGATRPAVNHVLQGFVMRGLIAVDGQVVTLRDLPGLRRRAGA